ncbi:hypothetical protein [Streptomyces litchfieldiae]|uniref:YD repeat-containing protein n=1 Tax=Streptomyces litchfieldiae TaxID=3075543 RepID=A0ABU2MWM1_9ACTN|nr:hypothetical protein [Streptomyces sp. DSM 44938]MDT0345871.1 hypothetical protein [Streptomyces sp. DSM 44938]
MDVVSLSTESTERSETYTYDQAGNILSIAEVSGAENDVQCFQYPL